jgi:hypothetical protein
MAIPRGVFAEDIMTTINTKITIKHPRGVVRAESASTPTDIVERVTPELGSLAAKQSVRATACIYCGSTDRLSHEHVVPYAWGGNLQIFDGSCEPCRLITSQFENFALNDGAMVHVRKARGIQSRSKHANSRKEVAVTLVRPGSEQVERFPASEVPLILGFPWLGRPGTFVGVESKGLTLEGWVTTSYGEEVQRFLAEHGATGMRVEESAKRPVAFARTLAKIAYGYAWIDGVFDTVQGGDELVQAFIQEPDRIGAFVGMKPPPFERYPDYQLRLEYKLWMPGLLVYMEVQPFVDTPAPTYEVLLGRCESVRAWRRLRGRFGSGFESAS